MIDFSDITFPANADLSGKQFRFVKMATGGKVDVCNGVTDIPIGVLQNKPTSGQAAQVRIFGNTQISASGALAVGNALGTDGNGQAAVYAAGTDTTKYLKGICTKATSALNDVGEMILVPIARGA